MIKTQIITTIIKAGEILLSAHDLENNDNLYSKTGTANFVTEYDIKTQEFLHGELKKIIPECNFISEENSNNSEDLNGYNFIIDPIDGTTNFIHDYRHSCISVGLCKDGVMILGFVYNPYNREMFRAEYNSGAYLNDIKIRVSERSLSDSLISFGTSPYYRERADRTFNMIKELYLSSRDVRRSGSAALDICYVACGRCDLFFELILSPWDYAAASLILREAGGIITAMDKSPVTFDRPCSILAANPVAYDEYYTKMLDKF